MGIRFTILASGSTGNSMVVQNDETTVLVDAGLSAKKIEQLMQEQGIAASDLDAIFVTHEHSDHIKGLGAIARKYDLPVFANRKTWEELHRLIGEVAAARQEVLATGESVTFGGLKIESYGISHDAAEPVGYCFYDGDEKLGLATDLGYMSEKVMEKLAESDVLILEANHDVEMLRMGKYPWNIKRRILGDTGHLSNETAGDRLADIWCRKTRRVYLAHLSRDHNMLDLARLTVGNILADHGIDPQERVKLMDTYYDRPTKWDRLADS